MFAVYLLGWWYGAGWKEQFKLTGVRVARVGKAFSGGTLLRTLFSPWKQLVSATERDAALGDKLRAVVDNIVSRFVGFMVRIITLLAACVTIVAVLIVNTIIIILWPLVPLLPIVLTGVWLAL